MANMLLASILDFFLEQFPSVILGKLKRYLTGHSTIDDRDSRTGSRSYEMGAEEAIWFDGVDKRLIAAHSKDKKDLVEASDQTLVTKVPLNILPKKRKGDDHTKNGKVSNKNVQNGTTVAAAASSSSRSKIDSIKPSTGITDELALDCEMVECYHHKSVLARVSIVNLFGHPILDTFVAPPSKVTDYRTRWSGIRKRDLDNAPDFDTVQAEVARIIKDKIVVGHAIHNDFSALKLSHPVEKTRDTSAYFKQFFLGKTPSLKKLSESILGLSIQKGEHDSVQDAQATMKLYVSVRDKWNEKLNKKVQSHPTSKKQKTKPKKKKIKAFYVVT